MNKELLKAVQIIREGGIVVFPTDTAYGIGCRLDDENAIRRLYTIRKRPLTQAAPVLVGSIIMAKKFFDKPPSIVKKLMGEYWPGALTIVAACRLDRIPKIVRGGGTTVGLRMPDHQVPLDLIKALNVPILGPSANFHNDPTPYSLSEVNTALIKIVDYVIEGKCTVRNISTVLDCTYGTPRYIRRGALVIPEAENI